MDEQKRIFQRRKINAQMALDPKNITQKEDVKMDKCISFFYKLSECKYNLEATSPQKPGHARAEVGKFK